MRGNSCYNYVYVISLCGSPQGRSIQAYNKDVGTIQKEIAIMKKMDHPNALALYEVIDDPTNQKVYDTMQ